MSILEEFWYGNIEPTEYNTSPSREYKEMLQLISRNEEKLLATMTDAQKDLFPVTRTVFGNFRPWQSVCCFRIAFGWAPELC